MIKTKDISSIFKRLCFILITVLVLASCSNNPDEVVVGETCDSEASCSACADCIDLRDNSCLSCQVMSIMYDAVGQNVMRLHSQFSQAAMAITMLGFAIWLALRLLKFTSSVTENNIGEVWNEIVRKAFICTICGFLASSPQTLQYVINTLVFPVYHAFMELGLLILESSLAGREDNVLSFTVMGTEINVHNVNIQCRLEGDFAVTENGFPASIREAINCQIMALTRYLTIGSDIAVEAMKQVGGLMPRIIGFILFCFFWIVKICFVFYLVDTIFQMGIIVLLLPLFIISYAFGPTKKWAGIGFKQILASAGFLMCFSIIVALVLRAMVSMIIANPEIFNPTNVEAAASDLTIGFICLLLIGFLIYGSMGVSQQLTSALLGAEVNSKFQEKLKAFVQGTGEAIVSGIGAFLTWGASMVPTTMFTTTRRVIQNAKSLRAKVRRYTGRDLYDR